MENNKYPKSTTKSFDYLEDLLDEFLSRSDYSLIGYKIKAVAGEDIMLEGYFTSRLLLATALKEYFTNRNLKFNTFKLTSTDFQGLIFDSLNITENGSYFNIHAEPFELNKFIE